ncbi:Transposase InsO and inactivated derivatives [Quadrisphaera granulorum]|uniref:Transposase InsO family protein n=1 Tax=Quadrisphaera granulorum TaxID=317664 RepID=A0A315ZJU3_9ACTN|nr:IS3 family transposase [Quadrisphaera granulorum]PWJ45811.1 transposase InsO family protein [Quadrisphaera granulorum]SZE99116.1 Transposase InsO and inactivated derivatives [Quadrisphaera granulorum]
MKTKYSFILSEEGNYSIRDRCTWLGVSRSGYHDFKTRPKSFTARWREGLTRMIIKVFHASDATYGYRRVCAEAARKGWPADPQTVRTIMAEQGLVSVWTTRRRRGPKTTVPGAGNYPDLINRDFTATEVGTKLVGDITYIPTWDGFAFMATVIDLATKKCVGYAIADHMRTDLVIEALAMARRNGAVKPDAIFHSDRGTQYMSAQFEKYCDTLNIRRSVGRTGICYDNAAAESFNGTLKVERCDRTAYPSVEHARKDVTRWVELRYNQTRIHSSLGYRTPNEMERELLLTAA